MAGFDHCIESLEALRELIPPPEATAIEKEVQHLDAHCRDFIARSPFLVIASAGADGRIDASPRGGPPGFVQTLDERRLVVPDYPGNRRLDSWQNVIATGHVQLMFFIPGMLEALRVSGRGVLTRDPAVLARCQDRGRTRPSTPPSSMCCGRPASPGPRPRRSTGPVCSPASSRTTRRQSGSSGPA